MKKILLLIVTIFLLSACSKDLNEKDNLEIDNSKDFNTPSSIDLGTTQEIKSELYKKYFEKYNESIQSDDDPENQEIQNRLGIEKVNDNRKIFIGNGDYLSFLSDKSQFYIDFLYDTDDFSLAYSIFKGDNISGEVIKEDLLIEVIKDKDDIKVKQENFDGEEKSVINFDEDFKMEVVEEIKNFVTNPVFNN